MTELIIDEEVYDSLSHYGIMRKSGRYPWGSGENAEARSRDFLGMVAELRAQGLSDPQIARSFSDPDDPKNPFTTTQLRAATTIARNQKRAADIATAQRYKYERGMSNGAIAEKMGLAGESSVRALLEPSAQERTDKLQDLANMIKQDVDEKGYVQVGVGVERYTGSSRTQFDTALSMLKSDEYVVLNHQVDQLGTNNKTVVKVLAKPVDGMTEKDHYRHLAQNEHLIQNLSVVRNDEGKVVPTPPFLSFDSKRLGINYSETNAKGEEIGGALADGVIYVRPGVKDVSLGGSQYAQVRVLVDGTHYLKGMAVYKNDLPDGVDLVFNTNKKDSGNKLDALKEVKRDKTTGKVIEDDPFGSQTKDFTTVRSVKDLFSDDGSKRLSVMNLVNEEGDWGEWSKNLASQMLSKQPTTLAKEQLAKAYQKKRDEFDEINSLTNPAVKKKLLRSFSDDVDSASVHLKAAAMKDQATQVILPLTKIKETEIFAPNFNDGDRVVLVRYPHGGTFEIPELVVNNKNPQGIELLTKAAKDAVGINPKVAERLSGADFDGDTVLVIPNNQGKVKSTRALEALKDFNPRETYKGFEGMPKMSTKQKQTEMGKVSNLITDMTIKGAGRDELARAVKHSMVVIDAEKHNLNYKQSAIDNGIEQLKKKYQAIEGKDGVGASTLISRTSRDIRVPERKQYTLSPKSIDPDTGEKIYNYTGAGYVKPGRQLKNGTTKPDEWIDKKTLSKEGAEVKDAHELIAGVGQPIERIYADHSNKLKALGNEARKEWLTTKSIPYSQSAKKVYDTEVKELNARLNVALKNAPQERQAQLVANAIVKQKRDANPDMDKDELKKISGKALTDARKRVGAGKTLVDIEDRHWEAIQAGAISNDKLEKILDNADLDRVKELATPRQNAVMTDSKKMRAQKLVDSGLTAREIATILGVPLSTLTSSLSGEE